MTEKNRLFVHIGTQKTGSSSIQKALTEDRRRLRKLGLLYPKPDASGGAFKHALIGRLAGDPGSDEAKEQVRHLMGRFADSGARTMIISDEALWRSDTSRARFFLAFKEHFEITVVAYLRRQDHYAESLYKQTFRTGVDGEARTIAEFCQSEEIQGRMDYHRILSEWRDVADHVVAVDFAKAAKTTGLVPSFYALLGLQGDEAPPDREDHKSPDTNAILAMRKIQQLGWTPERQRLYWAASVVEASGRCAPCKHLMGSALRQTLLASMDESNQRLSRDFGIEFTQDLPKEGEDALTEPPADYLVHLLGALTSPTEMAAAR
jgi:hypothetical protein